MAKWSFGRTRVRGDPEESPTRGLRGSWPQTLAGLSETGNVTPNSRVSWHLAVLVQTQQFLLISSPGSGGQEVPVEGI